MPNAVRPRRRLARYACDPEAGRGRLHREHDSPTRTAFQRDRDRIIHSAAFRRLQYKTQVFVYHEGDHFRTRLTHSLEVSQVARSLARSLELDEDLAEALALAHDLGHPPFGHAGERALAGCMAPHGGFDHNAQSLAAVTRLENRYVGFDGLNLTWESLEGLIKHNGPLVGGTAPAEILACCRGIGLNPDGYASLEAQCAAISDDIAYNSHDLDDGLRAGLFAISDARAAVPLLGGLIAEVARCHGDVTEARLQHELVRRLITALIEDVLDETRRRLESLRPSSVDDVRKAPREMVAFSPQMAREVEALRGFLFERMYRHRRVMEIMRQAEGVVRRLFDALLNDPGLLPREWRSASGGDRPRAVSDYIAGMTDRYALAEHRRLFDATPELR